MSRRSQGLGSPDWFYIIICVAPPPLRSPPAPPPSRRPPATAPISCNAMVLPRAAQAPRHVACRSARRTLPSVSHATQVPLVDWRKREPDTNKFLVFRVDKGGQNGGFGDRMVRPPLSPGGSFRWLGLHWRPTLFCSSLRARSLCPLEYSKRALACLGVPLVPVACGAVPSGPSGGAGRWG